MPAYSALRTAAADMRALVRDPLPTLFALAARTSLPVGQLLLRLVTDTALPPATPLETPMENKPEAPILDVNNNGIPDHRDPALIRNVVRVVIAELKKHPHTWAARFLRFVGA